MEKPDYLTTLLTAAVVGRNCVYSSLERVAEKNKMRPAECVLIFTLATNEEVKTVKEVAIASGVKKDKLEMISESLCYRGYIDFKQNKKGTKQNQMFLTEKGEKVAVECIAVFDHFIKSLIEGIPEENLEMCDDVLNTMFQNILAYIEKIEGQ